MSVVIGVELGGGGGVPLAELLRGGEASPPEDLAWPILVLRLCLWST